MHSYIRYVEPVNLISTKTPIVGEPALCQIVRWVGDDIESRMPERSDGTRHMGCRGYKYPLLAELRS